MPSITTLFTREAANAGAVLDVLGPDGKPCGLKMTVMGTDSDEFRICTRYMQRTVLAHLEGKPDEYRQSKEYLAYASEERTKLVASMVTAWEGVDEPCTAENVLALFKNAPYIVEQVDEFGSKRSRFGSNSLPVSEPSLSDKSS